MPYDDRELVDLARVLPSGDSGSRRAAHLRPTELDKLVISSVTFCDDWAESGDVRPFLAAVANTSPVLEALPHDPRAAAAWMFVRPFLPAMIPLSCAWNGL